MISRDRVLLIEVISTAQQFKAFKLRLFVVAWGQSFEGTIVSASEHAEIMAESLNARLQFKTDLVAAQSAMEHARSGLLESVQSSAEESNVEALHLKNVVAGNRELVLLRIPFDEIQAFSVME